MSVVAPLTEDQRDALQEITNIAMGQAASSLASLLDTFVNLSVPRINVVGVEKMSQSICELVGRDTEVTAVRQSFQGYLRGEAIVIFGQDGCTDLAELMGYDEALDRSAEIELLLDVTNVLVGACLGGIIEQLKGVAKGGSSGELSFSAPSLMAEAVPVDGVINPDKLTWSHALLMEVNFTLEKHNFISHLIMLMPEQAIDKMRGILDEFIASF
jgi:chemotaxis protein CheC